MHNNIARTASLILFVILTTWSPTGLAQQEKSGGEDLYGSNANYELGAHLGSFLPNQIEGVTEIMGMWGVRGGLRLGPSGFVELGTLAGKGFGAEWMNAHVTLRLDVPIETLVGSAFVGGDVTYFNGVGREQKVFGGGHVGGAVMALIGGSVWFRSDMKLNINPGTSLYVGFGLVMRLGGGSGQGRN